MSDSAKYPYIIAAEQFSTRFLVLDPNVGPTSPEAIVWGWNVLTDWDVDDKIMRTFGNPSEVKFVRNGTKLLVTASGGACALINVRRRKAEWVVYAGGNTHSAELLPDGNVVTASSTGAYLRLFDLQSDPGGNVFHDYELKSAHGVLYDEKKRLLYACGTDGLEVYSYDAETVTLQKVRQYKLGTEEEPFGGHDLSRDPADGKLLVSGTRGLLKVDPDDGRTDVITPVREIKSASAAPGVGTLLMIPTESWWSDRLCIMNEHGDIKDFIRVPHLRFYKARWILHSENVWLEPDYVRKL